MSKILNVIILGVVGFSLFKIFKGGSFFVKVSTESNLSNERAKILANHLFGAMSDFGTDEKTINDILNSNRSLKFK